MNFLLRNSQSSPSDNPVEIEKDSKMADGANVWQTMLPTVPAAAESYVVAEEPKEFGRTRMRMAIEDHHDVPLSEGSILIPYRDLPENWDSAPEVSALAFLDRGFVFPGEQLHILVHVSSRDLAVPDIITPFKVAEANRRASQNAGNNSTTNPDGQNSDIAAGGSAWKFGKAWRDRLSVSSMVKSPGGLLDGRGFNLSVGGGVIALPKAPISLHGDGQKRSVFLLSTFRKSHFFVGISAVDEQPTKAAPVVEHEFVESSLQSQGNDGEQEEFPDFPGCTPVNVEAGVFSPVTAGGVGRAAVASSALANGDVAVVLQLTIATDLVRADAVLEVSQYEKYEALAPSARIGPQGKATSAQAISNPILDPTTGLLQWLLPLDRPASPPSPAPPPPPVPSSISSPPPPRMSFSSSSSSTLFSFGALRTSSTLSAPALPPLSSSSQAVVTTPSFGPEDWDRSVKEKRNGRGQEVGSEGLLSFRGATLEPQRFSAHCGLQGPHVPGKRWRRNVAVLQPVSVKSYSANCNCQDLICVLVKNVLPADGVTEGVVIFVDALSIICQSSAPGSPPLPVPLACVDVGQNHRLPGVALRSGEQHSFILRPATPWKSVGLNGAKNGSSASSLGRDLQLRSFSGSKMASDLDLVDPSSAQYAVIISCHCSHTESRLYYKHSLQWRPKPQRNLLLSVSLDDTPPSNSSQAALSQFSPQVVTVQATNLTGGELDLTLLAPCSLASSPLSVLAFPTSPSPPALSGKRATSFAERKGRLPPRDVKRDKIDAPALSNAQLSNLRSMSLPPVRRMESVIGIAPTVLRERFVSAADIMADSNPARTHLWLQSAVPLGRIPAHSTTAVKCELLPLTDGIITLDTLHISTKTKDALYIPENPLQIYATSGIASGVS